MSCTNRRGRPSVALTALLLCAAGGCGRSSVFQDESDADDFSSVPGNAGGNANAIKGGASSTSSYALPGGSGASARSSAGGWTGSVGTLHSATGGASKAAGGARATGGYLATGGRVGTAGSSSKPGATSTGGIATTGGRASGGTSFGAAGFDASGGYHTGGTLPCHPTRVGTAGAAGTSGSETWYVDALRGSDEGPGTFSQPLKTLSCASRAARSGETVRLFEGTWNETTEEALSSRYTGECGNGSGIAFAPDVTLRTYGSIPARIISTGHHGICMSGGRLEGIRFECGTSFPIVETKEGTLEIIGSSLKNCARFGLDVAGTAQVTLRPGALSDYSEDPNYYFAAARGQSRLAIEGGKISYQAFALQAEDSATVELNGVTLSAQISGMMTGGGILLEGGAPHIKVRAGTIIDSASRAIGGYGNSFSLIVDDLTVVNSANGVMLSDDGAGVPSKIEINQLKMVDSLSLGVNLNGRFDLALRNSSFVRCQAPNVMLSGDGSVVIDSVVFDGGWGAMMFSGTESSDGLAVSVRNTKATGAGYGAVYVSAVAGDTFDFGTASSPGNNVFSGNSLNSEGPGANFLFFGPSGMIIKAAGNTWDANQQGADASGKYNVATPGVPLDVTSGNGTNYKAETSNLCTLRLAE